MLARLRCAVIGHHQWPHGTWTDGHDYIEPHDPRCERCGREPEVLRRWHAAALSPIWITRRRWKVTLRVDIPYKAYVSVGFNLGGKRDEQGPEIDASLILWRFNVYAWLGGFQWTNEDADLRSLVGISASFSTSPHEFDRLVCRVRGHVPDASLNGYVFCDRCQTTLERPERPAAIEANPF